MESFEEDSLVEGPKEFEMDAVAPASSIALPPFSALASRRLVVPSPSGGTYSVERHFLVRVMAQSISRIYFDAGFYCDKYPDVGQLIRSGGLKNPKEHYTRFGYFENRLPYRIQVDEEWYLATYPDVGAAVYREELESGQAHFEDTGFREGRLPFVNFQLRMV